MVERRTLDDNRQPGGLNDENPNADRAPVSGDKIPGYDNKEWKQKGTGDSDRSEPETKEEARAGGS